jgi:hypothetical protein
MPPKRGREARLKPEHAVLYPGLEPGAWIPVETLLRHITDLIHLDRSKSGIITGTRMLHQEHFEFRGRSARPTGLPAGSTRLSDSSAAPAPMDPARTVSALEPAKRKGPQE